LASQMEAGRSRFQNVGREQTTRRVYYWLSFLAIACPARESAEEVIPCRTADNGTPTSRINAVGAERVINTGYTLAAISPATRADHSTASHDTQGECGTTAQAVISSLPSAQFRCPRYRPRFGLHPTVESSPVRFLPLSPSAAALGYSGVISILLFGPTLAF